MYLRAVPCLGWLILGIGLYPSAPQNDSQEAIPDIRSGSWVSLFNGKDLSGWTQRNGTATYRVEEGAIVGKTAEGSPNSFLCSNADYKD
ncbi:MAG: family 16 glycoside hydrolase, partial [Planctomycetota bacterium]